MENATIKEDKAFVPLLGEKIEFNCQLHRKKIYKENTSGYRRRWKVWETVKFDTPMQGIVIGVRTISNGPTDFDSEAGYMYSPKEHFKALLVATTLHSKPILIPYPKI
jgi:hypothetical protein